MPEEELPDEELLEDELLELEELDELLEFEELLELDELLEDDELLVPEAPLEEPPHPTSQTAAAREKKMPRRPEKMRIGYTANRY